MAIEILMPALSPTMEEGTLAKWLVKEGDTVASGDLLAEIETDKATMEFEAVDEGIVGKILISEGTEGVKVNSPIAILLEEGESVDDAKVSSVDGSSHAAPAEASDATEPAKGYGREGGTKDPVPVQEERPQNEPESAAKSRRIFVTPVARRIANERDIDLFEVRGSGPRGRITKADVEAYEPRSEQTASSADIGSGAVAPETAGQKPAMPSGLSADQVRSMYEGRDFDEVKLDGMRKTIAARLTEAKQTIPHFYLRRDIRLDALLKFRGELNKQLESRGVKLSVNDFIIKSGANALQQVPDANAVWANDRILRLTPSDVAVAVAIEGGLFTPVLKNAHLKSLSALSMEMKDLASRARDRKLAPHEYQGGSFAISNLGMFGIDNFDAVINPPHGSILAVGAGIKKPIIGLEGEITAATVMSVTLSVDHRVIDGALGAQFLKALADNLENPITMLA
ncbi:Dihydrolipoyllysine-residue acetyltransferase component of pyruvate dehydrogenase complex [Jannaschia seosinensis]|uniref:Acetyltransferase component of pyruvate dehydrogenase complex n=1 Tax=Jannaschia seosinensis TaxID=313367 RepID=A0A0M7BHS2_9RHOB|nr:pyruvate dehydrogenase complex dihydrolipoamide acetyltransferase [Jannaschia seosinensis]CUH40935.1 Dihydrolipoyllysine-residue acetyltransferase component of pyruvate dehydrogenase complex [Jannaschia seosinensis]